MVYNEGFEIKLNNIELFNFAFYEKKSKIYKYLIFILDEKFITNCAKTLLGW